MKSISYVLVTIYVAILLVFAGCGLIYFSRIINSLEKSVDNYNKVIENRYIDK